MPGDFFLFLELMFKQGFQAVHRLINSNNIQFKSKKNHIMKKWFVLLFLGIAVAYYAYANPKVDFNSDTKDGIHFHKGNWNEALQIAKKENKLIFLDIYATWCGPCKLLKKHTFSNTEVGKFYNQNFVNVSLDGEDGEGTTLAQKYGISGYPTLLFIDGNGNVVAQTVGYHTPKELVKLGNKILGN